MPLYLLSIFKLPQPVRKQIIRIQREFLWGWGQKGRKMALVKWETICKGKEGEGLGIKDLKSFNMDILDK